MRFQELPFLDVFKDASGGNIKTPQKEFLEKGEIPVVDQGQSLVAGFVNERSRVCNSKPPVIVFGDHTRAIKYVDFEFAMGADGTKVLVPKVESDTKYLYYALNAIEIPAAGYSRHYKFLKETQIPLPPLAEQKRIAGILDAADALRAKRRESLAQLDTLLQSTFLDLFGDPVTNPMGWEIVPITDVVKGKYGIKAGPFGSALKKEDYVESGYRVYGQEQVIAGCFDVGDYYIDQSKYERLKACTVAEGDILVSLVGSYGKVLIVPDGIEPGIINPRLLKITPRQELVTSLHLATLIKNESTQKKLQSMSHGGTMGILNASLLKQLSIPLPPLDLQHRFAAIVESVEQQKTLQRAHLAELETLFASLQSRAFRGDL